MKICPVCGEQTEGKRKYCRRCGQRFPEDIRCPACGAVNVGVARVCCNCSQELVSPEAAWQPKPDIVLDDLFQKAFGWMKGLMLRELGGKLKRVPRKVWLWGGGGLAAVLLLVLVVSLLAGAGRSPYDYALYMKSDGELYYAGLEEPAPQKLTEGLSEDYWMSVSSVGAYTQISSDGKRLFFPDAYDGAAFCLYWQAGQEAEPVLIDTEVSDYRINEKGTLVFYRKDGILYRHDLTDKEKIASNIYYFQVSADGKQAVYKNKDGELYRWDGKESLLLMEAVEGEFLMTEDFQSVYYYKEGTLYRKTGSKEPVAVASDYTQILGFYPETGEVYYLKRHEQSLTLADFVEDDLAQADAAISGEPDYWAYDSYEAYQKDYDAYWDKYYRDQLRQQLTQIIVDTGEDTLYYFDGKEHIALAQGVDPQSVTACESRSLLVYRTVDTAGVTKLKLSHLTDIQEVINVLTEAVEGSSAWHAAVGENTMPLGVEKVEKAVFAPEGDWLLVTAEPDPAGGAQLYVLEVSRTKVRQPQKLDSGVAPNYGGFTPSGECWYFKNMDETSGQGQLFLNGKKLDSDVAAESVVYSEALKGLVYLTDWREAKEYGILKLYGKEAQKIADDVHAFALLPQGEVLYLQDYKLGTEEGSLYIHSGSDPKLLDEAVYAMVPITTD